MTDDLLIEELSPVYTREKIDLVIDTIPEGAKCCYTGQSILAYCPDPTFSWEEVNIWPDKTDVDIFCYNKQTLASVTQRFLDRGWQPASPIDAFKADRIRFFDASKRFNLQTVALTRALMPPVNLTWMSEATDVVTTVRRFDMDYLMVGMDVHTRQFVDFRGKDKRVANVNKLNAKFDVNDVDALFWARQFDRVPKGWSRGIDTRPVARTYLKWIEESIERGDRSVGSKTRYYADRRMATVIETVIQAGFTKEQAEAMYHLFRQEDSTWEALRINLATMKKTIEAWLASVEND